MREKHKCFVVTRHYDCTPVRTRFGQLQDQVMPHARYLWQDAEQNWKSLVLAEYLIKNPHVRMPRLGMPFSVLKLFNGITSSPGLPCMRIISDQSNMCKRLSYGCLQEPYDSGVME